jgi:uncharacterized membrane protein YkoI
LHPGPPSWSYLPEFVEGCPQRLTPLRPSAVVRILIPFTSNSHLHPLDSAQEPTKEREIRKVNVKKVLLAASVALVVLVGAGVAYASSNSASEKEADESYKGSVSVAGENESSLQKMAKIDQASAQRAALEAVPGKVHETELEASDNGYLVYDIEIAGNDGKEHEVTVDAGNGKVLHQEHEEETSESDGPDDTEAADDGPGGTEDADDGAGDKEDTD